MPYIGTGTTIAWETGFLAEIIDLTPPGHSREAINTSHKTTANNAHTFLPAKLVDYGEATVDIAFDPSTTPPITSAASTCTITFPDSGATQWSFSGFMTGYEPSEPLEERATATVTIKVTGPITIT